MKMIIRNLAEKDIPNLYSFNNRIYPEKKISAQDYIDFWFSQSPEEYKKTLVIVDDNGQICGQNIISSMSYFYNGETIDTVWGFDLIVDEDLRHSGWGADLLWHYKTSYPKAVSTGSGPAALPINLKLGNKYLGEIKKYIGIANPLHSFSSIYRGFVKIDDFPVNISVRGENFEKVKLYDDLPVLTDPYNPQLFEPCRDKDYLRWRFFNKLHQYAFYKSTTCNDYFVLRTIIIKKVTLLLLVDYRCNLQGEEGFRNIMNAVLKVAKALRLGIVSTGSSLAIIDRVLESKHFHAIGRPRPFIGFVKCKERKADIEARNFGLITFADSDGETNWE